MYYNHLIYLQCCTLGGAQVSYNSNTQHSHCAKRWLFCEVMKFWLSSGVQPYQHRRSLILDANNATMVDWFEQLRFCFDLKNEPLIFSYPVDGGIPHGGDDDDAISKICVFLAT